MPAPNARGGYQYVSQVRVLGVTMACLLDGCAGVNSVTEEIVIAALRAAHDQGIKPSDPTYPILQLERWPHPESVSGVAAGHPVRLLGAVVMRVELVQLGDKGPPKVILVRAKIFEAGSSDFHGLILGGRALDCAEKGGLGFRPLAHAHCLEAIGILMPRCEDCSEERPDKAYAFRNVPIEEVDVYEEGDGGTGSTLPRWRAARHSRPLPVPLTEGQPVMQAASSHEPMQPERVPTAVPLYRILGLARRAASDVESMDARAGALRALRREEPTPADYNVLRAVPPLEARAQELRNPDFLQEYWVHLRELRCGNMSGDSWICHGHYVRRIHRKDRVAMFTQRTLPVPWSGPPCGAHRITIAYFDNMTKHVIIDNWLDPGARIWNADGEGSLSSLTPSYCWRGGWRRTASWSTLQACTFPRHRRFQTLLQRCPSKSFRLSLGTMLQRPWPPTQGSKGHDGVRRWSRQNRQFRSKELPADSDSDSDPPPPLLNGEDEVQDAMFAAQRDASTDESEHSEGERDAWWAELGASWMVHNRGGHPELLPDIPQAGQSHADAEFAVMAAMARLHVGRQTGYTSWCTVRLLGV